MKWQLLFHLHWPHDRLAIGWEYIGPNEHEEIYTFNLYWTIITTTLDIYSEN